VTAFFLFDTSALVKRYHLEPGSDKVDEIFEDTDNVLRPKTRTFFSFLFPASLMIRAPLNCLAK
jgi:hypothetical protein